MAILSGRNSGCAATGALEKARRTLLPITDRDGFEVELHDGVLDVLFERAHRRQVRRFAQRTGAPDVGIRMARSYKLAWSPERGAFMLDGETLSDICSPASHARFSTPRTDERRGEVARFGQSSEKPRPNGSVGSARIDVLQ
jgi:hypothetical protein